MFVFEFLIFQIQNTQFMILKFFNHVFDTFIRIILNELETVIILHGINIALLRKHVGVSVAPEIFGISKIALFLNI